MRKLWDQWWPTVLVVLLLSPLVVVTIWGESRRAQQRELGRAQPQQGPARYIFVDSTYRQTGVLVQTPSGWVFGLAPWGCEAK